MALIEQFDDLRPGLVVERLTYYSFDFSLPLSDTPAFDEAADAVLDFDGGVTARFTWYQQGPIERLTIGSHAIGTDEPCFSDDMSDSGSRRKVDATDRWGLAGLELTGHEVIVGESSDGSIQPWSCRLDFGEHRSLVVALGEVTQSGAPTYMPDSILITADQRLAESYRTVTSSLTAWGSVV